MHLPERNPRHSVFFDYKIYPFRRPPEMDGSTMQHPVAIAGAGLIGMALALDLARFGVASVLIESEAQVSHGSRALALTRRSTEILCQIGVGKTFLNEGMAWSHGDSFFRGQKVYEMVMPSSEDESCPPALNLAQQRMEEILVEACEASDLVDLRWQTRVTGIAQDETGVRLELDTPEGPYGLEAGWVVAADGGRSTVRTLMGLKMEGRSYSGNFVITDIKADLNLPPRRQCHFDPEWNPGNNVLIHRQPGGMWRLDYKLPDGETPEQALEAERVADRVNRILAMVGQPVEWELDWATVYHPNTLTLPDYRSGRVLFAGDAAHLLPIFGVRGANTGFQDGNDLAWKLAAVAKGEAPLALLDTYSSERVQAAREICEEGGKSTRFMTPQTAGQRLLRDAVLSLSLTEGFASDLMHWRTSRPHTYHDSPLNAGTHGDFAGGPDCGDAVRDARVGSGRYLLQELTRPGFHLLVFSDATPSREVAQLLSGVRALDYPPVTVLIGADETAANAAKADFVFADPDGHAAARYDARPGTTYLLRPDFHVCGRWRAAMAPDIAAALDLAMMRKTEDA